MSITKRFIELWEEEENIKQNTSLLLEDELIQDSRCQGIGRQIKYQGINNLSNKQNYLYKKHIEPLFYVHITNCEYCSEKMVKDFSDDYLQFCSQLCFKKFHKIDD